MNKRQAKKMRNKVVYPLVDEMNLAAASVEEREAAYEDFDKYVQKHYRYFHYKDKYKVLKKTCLYVFPVQSEERKFLEDMIKRVRTYHQPTKVTQEFV